MRLLRKTLLKMAPAKRTMFTILARWLPMALTLAPSQIRVDPDGGYTGLVIKIDNEVPEDLCPQILSNLQVREQSLRPYKQVFTEIRYCYLFHRILKSILRSNMGTLFMVLVESAA